MGRVPGLLRHEFREGEGSQVAANSPCTTLARRRGSLQPKS